MSLDNDITSPADNDIDPFSEDRKPSKLLYTRDFLLSLSALDICKKLPSGFDASVLRMSLDNEIRSTPDNDADQISEDKKPSKLSYTRDFLLSLSELDICKKLPSGFDASVLSEFEDASYGTRDQQRIPGSSPLLSYRGTEYGSYPLTKGDSSNYSRGTYGKWDSYSSRRSERDSDSRHDWVSDSGSHHFNHPQRYWKNPEHDGLLGSGSFPKQSGNAAGLSGPKARPSDPHQLNRSNEPYPPPRLYTAVPHLRRGRGATDSYNAETFGCTESTSQDKTEEERRRRESFELTRKEQQKAIQEQNPDMHKDSHDSDFTASLGDIKDGERVFNRSNDLVECMTLPVSNNESCKSSQIPGSRPLVPPGFKSTILDKNSSSKSINHSHSAEVGQTEIEQICSDAKAIVKNGTLDSQEECTAQKIDIRERHQENTGIHALSFDKGKQIMDSSAVLEVSLNRFGMEDHLYRTSSLSEASERHDRGESVEFDTQKYTGHKIIGGFKQDHSTTILQKLFGSASKVDLSGSSNFIKHRDTEGDETWSSDSVQSSKFAQWFLEDEKVEVENPPQGRSSDLLSLIVGEKGGSQVFDLKGADNIQPPLSVQCSELTDKHLTSNSTSSTFGISEYLYNSSKQEMAPAILTCEDLEQTILSEYSGSSSTLQASVQGWSSSGANTEEPKAVIDNLASQHLMSLLQKGTCLINNTDSPMLDNGFSGKLHVSGGAIVGSAIDNSREEKTENIQKSGKSLTLETLFGSAFMKELQSVGAPVSVRKGSAGSARIDVSDLHGSSSGVFGDSLGIGSNRSNYENNALRSRQRHQSNSDKVFENWLGFSDAQIEVDSSMHQNDAVSKLGGFDAAVEIQLPEEESLITVGDPLNTHNSMFMSAANSIQGELLYSNKPVDIHEKLGTHNTFFDERPIVVGQEGPPFVRGPYDSMEPAIPYHNIHGQPSSPQFQSPHMNHGSPFLRPIDIYPSRVSSQMNFRAPEGIFDHHVPANHQFPVNMVHPRFPHPFNGQTALDLPRHSMLQQMQIPGNFPPPNLLQEFARGGLLTPHSGSNATGFRQAVNRTQSLPFVQHQSNFGGLGMRLQAPDVSGGSNNHPPEALEMAVNSRKKTTAHPFRAVSHNQQGGHDLDMGFRYR